jgi:hypothetical protein
MDIYLRRNFSAVGNHNAEHLMFVFMDGAPHERPSSAATAQYASAVLRSPLFWLPRRPGPVMAARGPEFRPLPVGVVSLASCLDRIVGGLNLTNSIDLGVGGPRSQGRGCFGLCCAVPPAEKGGCCRWL